MIEVVIVMSTDKEPIAFDRATTNNCNVLEPALVKMTSFASNLRNSVLNIYSGYTIALYVLYSMLNSVPCRN